LAAGAEGGPVDNRATVFFKVTDDRRERRFPDPQDEFVGLGEADSEHNSMKACECLSIYGFLADEAELK
jgi:hypothetical protein